MPESGLWVRADGKLAHCHPTEGDVVADSGVGDRQGVVLPDLNGAFLLHVGQNSVGHFHVFALLVGGQVLEEYSEKRSRILSFRGGIRDLRLSWPSNGSLQPSGQE